MVMPTWSCLSFVYLSSIIFHQIIEPINFSFRVNIVWFGIILWHNTKPYDIHHRRKIYWLNNTRANNRGKVTKKCQCFIYNPTPNYKYNKNYLQKIKAHGFFSWLFEYLATTTYKIFWDNCCIMRGLKVKLSFVLNSPLSDFAH